MNEVKMPSGATLKILKTPFVESKALYQSVLEELKGVSLTAETDMASVIKDVFCLGFSSKKIDLALSVCMKRCTYNDLKIDDSTFDTLEAREDYTSIVVEVLLDNCGPFLKNLSVGLSRLNAMMPNIRA